jgi:cold-inducible RNA-binding protein
VNSYNQLVYSMSSYGEKKMNIYVGNLSYNMTDEDLEKMFQEFGTVSESKIITDRDTGRSKGFGFVEMPNQAEGDEAIKELDGKEIDGRSIKVNVAKPKEDRPRRRERY